MPVVCVVHHLACTMQPKGHTGIGQMFPFLHMGWWNIVQVKMLHWKPVCNFLSSGNRSTFVSFVSAILLTRDYVFFIILLPRLLIDRCFNIALQGTKHIFTDRYDPNIGGKIIFVKERWPLCEHNELLQNNDSQLFNFPSSVQWNRS